jgi:hypothetical protein
MISQFDLANRQIPRYWEPPVARTIFLVGLILLIGGLPVLALSGTWQISTMGAILSGITACMWVIRNFQPMREEKAIEIARKGCALYGLQRIYIPPGESVYRFNWEYAHYSESAKHLSTFVGLYEKATYNTHTNSVQVVQIPKDEYEAAPRERRF